MHVKTAWVREAKAENPLRNWAQGSSMAFSDTLLAGIRMGAWCFWGLRLPRLGLNIF
ncbi:MAG: hypothetical protein FWG10_14565 [Eubacteriaceae bacterium]|nr:hypothetical protein [Eubacteriaceae bacterium]